MICVICGLSCGAQGRDNTLNLGVDSEANLTSLVAGSGNYSIALLLDSDLIL